MGHMKTWDMNPTDVGPPVDAVPKRADLSQRKRPPGGEGSPEAALPLELALITECTKLFSLFRRDLLSREELEQALHTAEDHYRCRSKDCDRFADFLNDHGYLVCARCFNAGCRCPGCEQDRGWSDYKDQP